MNQPPAGPRIASGRCVSSKGPDIGGINAPARRSIGVIHAATMRLITIAMIIIVTVIIIIGVVAMVAFGTRMGRRCLAARAATTSLRSCLPLPPDPVYTSR